MRASLGLPTHRVDGDLASADAIAVVAAAAEEAGFDAAFVTDHPFPSDRWLATGGHHALDPFVALSYAASATARLRLHLNLLIPAYRNPFVAAKAVASLDALSGGRVVVGVGAGYLEPEFAALGVDYAERNELTDEALTAMRAAWTGESVTATGRHWAATGNTMLPRPAQQPGPPIWVGGNSRRAIRRAVELGDGWMPMPSPAGSERRLHTPPITSHEELATRIRYAREHATSVGRTAPLEIVFMPDGLDMFTNAGIDATRVIDGIGELAGLGVTYLTVSLPGDTRAAFLDQLESFARDVLEPVREL
ncbi:MAG TPA: TIGR03619 family F420-dependent LLM class oxidoreductase [Acidimicrobiia bacterium]|nr:TIGR03619 family F420-dependent LLM class oxidoreductase [Acidimicrobiia bacterium]